MNGNCEYIYFNFTFCILLHTHYFWFLGFLVLPFLLPILPSLKTSYSSYWKFHIIWNTIIFSVSPVNLCFQYLLNIRHTDRGAVWSKIFSFERKQNFRWKSYKLLGRLCLISIASDNTLALSMNEIKLSLHVFKSLKQNSYSFTNCNSMYTYIFGSVFLMRKRLSISWYDSLAG